MSYVRVESEATGRFFVKENGDESLESGWVAVTMVEPDPRNNWDIYVRGSGLMVSLAKEIQLNNGLSRAEIPSAKPSVLTGSRFFQLEPGVAVKIGGATLSLVDGDPPNYDTIDKQ